MQQAAAPLNKSMHLIGTSCGIPRFLHGSSAWFGHHKFLRMIGNIGTSCGIPRFLHGSSAWFGHHMFLLMIGNIGTRCGIPRFLHGSSAWFGHHKFLLMIGNMDHTPQKAWGGRAQCFLRITHVNGASPWHWNKKRKLIIDSFKPLTCPQIGRADFFKDLRNRSQPATCNKQLHL